VGLEGKCWSQALLNLYFSLWLKLWGYILFRPGTVSERSKTCTVFVRSEAVVWVRIPQKPWIFSMCMCLFCVCVVLCLGRGLATSWTSVKLLWN
jgi:hypothetical protein